MRNLILLLFSTYLINSDILAQACTVLNSSQILEERQELYFTFEANKSELEFFNRILSLDGYDGRVVYAYANPQQFEKFIQTGKDFDIVHSYYSKDKNLNMALSVEEMENWDRYPSYDVYVEMMQNFANDFPEICKLDTIGYSYDNRLILMVEISENINDVSSKPKFLYTGQMHGDELVSGHLFLKLIDYLLNNYESDSQVTKLINELHIFINPYANPDGTYYGGNNTVEESRRNNNQNIDLNRNFPDPIDGNNPDGNEHAVETLVFMELAENNNFVMSGNSHSGAEVMNYPFDTYSTLPADNDWWYFVCREYANHAQENSPAGYFTDLNNGVTHGYSWYSINGSRQDYMNYFHNCREATLEQSGVKKLDSDLLPAHWNYNKQALLDYMEQATYGLRGVVTDSITDLPLNAKIEIDNHDFFNSHVFSKVEDGHYYRLLYEGIYNVTFSAEGYKSKTFEIEINNYEQTILDVQLVSLDLLPPYPSFYADNQVLTCSPTVQFINTSEASSETLFLWDFGDGSDTSSEINPVHTYAKNGAYNVSLYAQNSNGENTALLGSFITVNLSEINNYFDAVICGEPESVELTVDEPGEIQWFDSKYESEPFFIGNTYITPIIENTKSYFVQSFLSGESDSAGELDNSAGGSYNDNSSNHYLVFDCYAPVILESVKVYAESSGERTIFLSNSNGEHLKTTSIFIEEGEQTLELNIDLPVGNDLRLGCFGPSNLFRGFKDGATFDFPYSNDFVSIKRSNTTWWNDHTRYYSFFYNWQLKEKDCVSEKKEIFVYVNEDVIADFDYVIENNELNLINKSIAADSFTWDLGDGNSTHEKNPMHQYSESGNYKVTLMAESDCGLDSISKYIVIETGIILNSSEKIKIYPNPVKDILNINATIKPVHVSIFNANGMLVYMSEIQKNNHQINIKNLQSGLYFLRLFNHNGIIKTEKIIIL